VTTEEEELLASLEKLMENFDAIVAATIPKNAFPILGLTHFLYS
jgi:hypothetical protein